MPAPDLNDLCGVRVVDLRKRVYPEAGDYEVSSQDHQHRQYRYRFSRCGHWRTYKHERFSEEVRNNPIWVPRTRLIGPEDAPVKSGEVVNLLRR